MIKIELTDVESTCADSLKLTGEYLIQMAELRKITLDESTDAPIIDDGAVRQLEVEPPESEESEPVDIQNETLPSPAEIFAKPIQLHSPGEPLIEEELIVVPPAPAVEVDADGLPWDKRIHSRTRSKVKDGTWKKQRGLGRELLHRVENELRQVMNLPPAPPLPPRPLFVITPPPPEPPVFEEVENPLGLTAPESLDAHIPDLPEVSFMDLMSFVTSSIVAGTLHREGLTDLLKPFGIPALPLVANRPDLIPLVMHAAQEAVAKATQNAQ